MYEVVANVSDLLAQCHEDIHRNSCSITMSEQARRDLVALTRLITSCLSILGASSIIYSALKKRQLLSPKVHPLFMLSVADLMLAILWVIGSGLWLYRDHLTDRAWCFTASLSTVILECITVNLTLVYALLAYSNIRGKDFHTLLNEERIPQISQGSCGVWHPPRTIAMYFVAWVFPVVLIMVPFGVIAGICNITHDARTCSCWCLPIFGNVLPFAFNGDMDGDAADKLVVSVFPFFYMYYQPTAKFRRNMGKLLITYSVVLSAHYLFGFIMLVVIYYKVLKYIATMRRDHEQNRSVHRYGVAQTIIVRGQTQAKKRVIYFLTVFVISGFFNLVLSLVFAIAEALELRKEVHVQDLHSDPYKLKFYVLGALLMQSVTVPLQGFLNAIVYGWTREDFLNVMVDTPQDENRTTPVTADSDIPESYSGLYTHSQKLFLVSEKYENSGEDQHTESEHLETEFEED